MCHFITAVGLSGVESVIRAVAIEHGVGFAPLAGSPVLAQLERGEGYYLTTTGHCDCGTPLGAAKRGRDRDAKLDHKVRRLRAKGWSESKIAKWSEQTRANREAKDAEREQHIRTCEAWRHFIEAALDAGAGSLGLMMHWYRDGVLTERVEILRRVRVRRADLTPELLAQLEEDVLYDFVS